MAASDLLDLQRRIIAKIIASGYEFYDDLWVDKDLRVGQGLFVGGTGVDPVTGNIWVDKTAAAAETWDSSNNPAVRIKNTNATAYNEKAMLHFSVGNNSNPTAAIGAVYTIWGGGGDPSGSDLVFFTKTHTQILQERMRILYGGDIGIGITAPLSRLHVKGSQFRWQEATQDIGILINGAAGYAEIRAALASNMASYQYLALQVGGGRVGIGTSSPSHVLHVKGGRILAEDNEYWAIGITRNDYVGATYWIGMEAANSGGLVFSENGGTNRMILTQSGSLYLFNGVFYCGNYGGGAKSVGDIVARRSATTGVYYFGENNNHYLYWDGSTYTFGGTGNLSVPGIAVIGTTGTDANRYNVYWNSVSGHMIFVASDERLKKDIDYKIDGLNIIKKLKPACFTFKENNQRHLGFIAQNAIKADPRLAWHNKENDQWGLDGMDGFVAVSIKAIQELTERVEKLESVKDGSKQK